MSARKREQQQHQDPQMQVVPAQQIIPPIIQEPQTQGEVQIEQELFPLPEQQPVPVTQHPCQWKKPGYSYMHDGLASTLPYHSEDHKLRLNQAKQLDAVNNSSRFTQLCIEYPDATETNRSTRDGFPPRFLRLTRNAEAQRPLQINPVPIGTIVQQPNGTPQILMDPSRSKRLGIKVLETEIANRRIMNLHNARVQLRTFQSVQTDIEFTDEMQVALRTFNGTLYVLERYGPAITMEGILKAHGASWEKHLEWLGIKTPTETIGHEAQGRIDQYRSAYQAACFWADHHERTIYGLAGPLGETIEPFSFEDYDNMFSVFVTYVLTIIGKIHAGRVIDPKEIRNRYAEGIKDELQQTIDEHINSFVSRKYSRTASSRRPMIPKGTRVAGKGYYIGSGRRHRTYSTESRKGRNIGQQYRKYQKQDSYKSLRRTQRTRSKSARRRAATPKPKNAKDRVRFAETPPRRAR
ncbi:unnamed protein product [Trypanosoma congolense IL3000]|uniref:WGS project CAEQ00000000 data, annotated contig 2100 n=1 Tax=Trypanosoma congolense (strain IL3000) TaxID=1068625 RepID=F9WBF8_TRYCI|nr:unnamed protein product [Trypanosoma congolense IL3000]